MGRLAADWLQAVLMESNLHLCCLKAGRSRPSRHLVSSLEGAVASHREKTLNEKDEDHRML